MRSYHFTCLVVTSFLYLFTTHASANIIGNGDFEAGNTGFTSDYIFVSNNNDAGQYGIGTDPHLFYSGFISYGDHTTGSGLMMMVNGATSPIDVWSQVVPTTPNTSYEFSGFLASITGGAAQLDMRVDGTSIGVFTASPEIGLGIWEGFSFLFNSGDSSLVTISIADLNLAWGGNDFTLDDLSLTSAVPIPPALWLFGSGLLGLIGIARRKKVA